MYFEVLKTINDAAKSCGINFYATNPLKLKYPYVKLQSITSKPLILKPLRLSNCIVMELAIKDYSAIAAISMVQKFKAALPFNVDEFKSTECEAGDFKFTLRSQVIDPLV